MSVDFTPAPQTAMETDDPTWEWIARDANMPIAIVEQDQIPLPPSTRSRGRYADWMDQTDELHILELKGRSPQEIEDQVGRIRLHSNFKNLQEFQHCLDRLCILHGQVVTKIKSTWVCFVRVCRFRKGARQSW